MGGILSYTAQNCDTFDYKAEIRGIQIRRLNDKISELENMISKHGDDLSEKYNELKELNNSKNMMMENLNDKINQLINKMDLKID